MGDRDAVADTRAHDLLAVEYGLQDLLSIRDRVTHLQLIYQLADDLLFGVALEAYDSRLGGQDVQKRHNTITIYYRISQGGRINNEYNSNSPWLLCCCYMDREDSIESTVLLIAYHYPPVRSTGVQRVAKFEQYLPEFGYRTKVLTTAAFGTGAQNIGVLRAWEPLGPYRWLFNRRARQERGAAARVRTESNLTSGCASAVRRLSIPDTQVTWIPAASAHALNLLRAGVANLIYSTYPPASAHLVALIAKQMTGVPWVADFRDSWTSDPLDPDLLSNPHRLALERQMESTVVRTADAIITSTPVAADYLKEAHPQQADRIHVITNGYDPEEFTEKTEPPAFETTRPMHLVHTGSFSGSHPWRSPHGLLEALQLLLTTDPSWSRRLKVTLAGHLTRSEAQATAALGSSGVVQTVAEADHGEALTIQREGDVLLLVDHPRPWRASNLPNKLFEYLAMQRPILALCTAGMVADTVSGLKAGMCAAPDDPRAIATVIERLYGAFANGTLQQHACRAPLHHFHRRFLTRQLAACFDDVLAQHARSPGL